MRWIDCIWDSKRVLWIRFWGTFEVLRLRHTITFSTSNYWSSTRWEKRCSGNPNTSLSRAFKALQDRLIIFSFLFEWMFSKRHYEWYWWKTEIWQKFIYGYFFTTPSYRFEFLTVGTIFMLFPLDPFEHLSTANLIQTKWFILSRQGFVDCILTSNHR